MMCFQIPSSKLTISHLCSHLTEFLHRSSKYSLLKLIKLTACQIKGDFKMTILIQKTLYLANIVFIPVCTVIKVAILYLENQNLEIEMYTNTNVTWGKKSF